MRGVPEVTVRVVVVRNPAQVAAVDGDGGPAADVVGAVHYLPRPLGAAPRGELQVVRRLVPVCYPGVVAAVQGDRVVLAVVVGVVDRQGLVDPVGAVVVGVAERVVLVVVVGDVRVAAAVQVEGRVHGRAVLVHYRLEGLDGPSCPVVVRVLQPRVVGAPCIPVPVREMEVPSRVDLHAVPGLPGSVIGIIDDNRVRPTRAVERPVHQLPAADLVVCQVQVLRGGIPSDAEVLRFLAGHRGHGGDVAKVPRVDELLRSLVVAQEVHASSRFLADSDAPVAVTCVGGGADGSRAPARAVVTRVRDPIPVVVGQQPVPAAVSRKCWAPAYVTRGSHGANDRVCVRCLR